MRGQILRSEAIVPALASRPTIHEYLYGYWEAFFALHKARSAGFSVNPISLSGIAAYLAILGVCDAEERQEYLYFIQQMDQEFMRWMSEKNKNSKGKK